MNPYREHRFTDAGKNITARVIRPQTQLQNLASHRNWDLLRLSSAIGTFEYVAAHRGVPAHLIKAMRRYGKICETAVKQDYERKKRQLRKEEKQMARAYKDLESNRDRTPHTVQLP